MKTYYVYALYVEGEHEPFYIGKSYIGSVRFSHHKHYGSTGKRHSASYSKIKAALDKNLTIVEKVLMTTENEQDAFTAERAYIKLYGRKDNGTGILCNHTDGGEGTSGHACPENTKAAVASANKRRVWDEAARARQAEKSRGRVLSDTSRAKLSKQKQKAVIVTLTNGEFIGRFESITAASQITGLHRATVSRIVNKHVDSVNNYIIEFASA